MVRSAAFDWGRCPCGGTYEHHLTDVRMTVAGEALTLSDVPQGRCPSCGSRVYKAESIARVEETMKGDPLDRRLNRYAI